MKLDAKLQWWVSKGSFSKRFGSLVHSFFTQGRKNSSIPATTTTTTPPAAATTTAESCNCCCYCHCYGYCYCSCSCCFLLLLLLLLLLLILLLLLLCCDPCCPNCLLERHSHCHDTRRLEKHADCVLLPSVLMIVTYYFCASHQSYCCSRCYQCDALSSLSNALTTGLSVVLAVPMPRNTRSMSATTRAHVQGPRLGQLWSWGQTSPPPVRAICRPRVKSEFRRLEGKTA